MYHETFLSATNYLCQTTADEEKLNVKAYNNSYKPQNSRNNQPVMNRWASSQNHHPNEAEIRIEMKRSDRVHSKWRSTYQNLRNEVCRTRLTKCKSQLGSVNDDPEKSPLNMVNSRSYINDDKHLGTRKDSLSRKADFIRVESKQIDDNCEPSWTSTESQGSLRIQRFDEDGPISFRTKSKGKSQNLFLFLPTLYS